MASGSNNPGSSSRSAPPVVVPSLGNNIILNPLQRGNPILEHVRVGQEYGDIVADYQVGRTTGVLYLSLKYHRLHPEYIHTRIQKLGHSYNLRILLIQSDISEHKEPIRELTKTCLINDITIIVAFSSEEAGHYLTTFKQFEHKPPTMIKERVDKDYRSMLRATLTSISRVNKTDVETLRISFGSLAGIAKASTDQLQNLPGFGHVKVKNIKSAFEKPFRNSSTNSLAFLASQSTAAHAEELSKEAPSSTSNTVPPSTSAMDKGKVKETTPPSTPRARKENSPMWDIEREFRSDVRGESPPWDIELDLN